MMVYLTDDEEYSIYSTATDTVVSWKQESSLRQTGKKCGFDTPNMPVLNELVNWNIFVPCYMTLYK